jgi:hypothetical protein
VCAALAGGVAVGAAGEALHGGDRGAAARVLRGWLSPLVLAGREGWHPWEDAGEDGAPHEG